MSVPSYEDLGRSYRDVYHAGYFFDLIKIGIKKPVSSVNAELDGSYEIKNHTKSLSTKWKYPTETVGTTSVNVSSEGPLVAECSYNVMENLNVIGGYSYNTSDAFQAFKLRVNYNNPYINTYCSLTQPVQPTEKKQDFYGSIVLKVQNFLLGYEGSYNAESDTLKKNDIAIGIDLKDVVLNFRCFQFRKDFGLSMFYRVNDTLQISMDGKMENEESNTTSWNVGVGFKAKVHDLATLRMRFDRNMQIGTNLQLALYERAKMTLGFNLDLPNREPKFGLGLEFEA